MTAPTPDVIRIFVDAKPVDAHPGETVIDAITRWDPAVAETLRAESRALADSRGLVTPLDTPVHGGAIFRVVSARQLRANDDPFADAADTIDPADPTDPDTSAPTDAPHDA